jgi:hypothetical protein
MAVWELVAVSNDLTQFVATNREDVQNEVFYTNGQPKTWATRPSLTVFIEPRKKKQKPLGDVSFILPGSVILNQKAYAALGDFLGKFGQFLEAECIGEAFYFYNVTNIISCIDSANSQFLGRSILKAAFHADLEPKDAQVFKDPLKLKTAIYVSDVAKGVLDGLVNRSGITGIRFENCIK